MIKKNLLIKFLTFIFIFAACFGLLLSILLIFEYFGATITIAGTVICGSESSMSSCSIVAESKYSALRGIPFIGDIPIAVFGVIFYGFIAGIFLLNIFYKNKDALSTYFTITALTVIALVIDLALFLISVIKIHHICFLCGLTYITNIIIFVLAVIFTIFTRQSISLSSNVNLKKYLVDYLHYFIIIILLFASVSIGIGSIARKISFVNNKTSILSQKQATLNFLSIELQIPSSETEKKYLGLSGKGNFKLSEIKCQTLMIEVYNLYCTHCRISAPIVNEVYKIIEDRADLKYKIKLIGIAAGNTHYETGIYKEKYHADFPLFPDKSGDISAMLGAKNTPAFIVFKKNKTGKWEQIYFHEGEINSANNLLTNILK